MCVLVFLNVCVWVCMIFCALVVYVLIIVVSKEIILNLSFLLYLLPCAFVQAVYFSKAMKQRTY